MIDIKLYIPLSKPSVVILAFSVITIAHTQDDMADEKLKLLASDSNLIAKKVKGRLAKRFHWQVTRLIPAILLLGFSLRITMAKIQLTSLSYVALAVNYATHLAITAFYYF